MNKITYRAVGLIMVLVLTLSIHSTGRATSEAAIMEGATINIAHFFKPPTNMNAATAATHFNSFVLTNGDHQYMAALRASGYRHTIPEYFRFEAIQDPGSCTATPLNNQVAYNPGDFCDISTNHPDWFLLDNNGNRMTVSDSAGYYRMDPGNAGWRAFFVQRVIENQTQYGWSGLFLDNVEASLGKFFGNLPARYPTDAQYQAAVAGFLQYIDVNYSARLNRPVVANIITRRDDATWFNYLQYLDAAMQERFAVNWNETEYLREDQWLQDLQLMEETQGRGKYVILVAPGYQADTNRQKFAFASYLLINRSKAAFRYSTDDAYREVWLYDNYNLQLGSPLGAKYQQNGVWRRDFTNGYVIVDPVNHTATISTTPPVTPTRTPTRVASPTRTPTRAPANTIFDERNSAFSYSNGWTQVTDAQAYNGTFKRTGTIGSSVTLSFTGQRFTVIYKTGPLFGSMDIYVDGNRVHTLNQNTATALYQQRWSYGGTLSSGTHQLKLVYSSGPADGRVSIDAVSIP